MKHRTLLTLALFLLFTPLMADVQKDTAFAKLYRTYFQLYADTNEAAFYDVSEQLKAYYLKAHLRDS